MVNGCESRVPQKSEYEQPVGNVDVHNTNRRCRVTAWTCWLCIDLPESCVFVSGDGVVPYPGGTGRARFAARIQVGPGPRSSCFLCSSNHRGKHRLQWRIGFNGVRPESVCDRLTQNTSTGMSSQFGTHTSRETRIVQSSSDQCYCSPHGEIVIPQQTLCCLPGSMASPLVPAASYVKSPQDPIKSKESLQHCGWPC